MVSLRFVTGFKSPVNGRFKATNLADGIRVRFPFPVSRFPFPGGVADFSIQYQNNILRSPALILPADHLLLKRSSNPMARSYLLRCCLAALI